MRVAQLTEGARKTFRQFTEFVMTDNENRPLKLEEIHLSWIEFIFECLRLKIFPFVRAVPGHGKSTLCANALPLWLLGKFPNYRIGIISNTDPNAQKRIMVIKRYIEENERYHAVFPSVQPDYRYKWTDHMLYIKRNCIITDPSVIGYGVESSGTGSRMDVQILDDPVDMDNTIRQPSKKEMIKRKYWETWWTRLQAPRHTSSFALGIGNSWADDDLISDLKTKADWRVLDQGVSDDFSHIKSVYITVEKDLEGNPEQVLHERKIQLWSKHGADEFLRSKENMPEFSYIKCYQGIFADSMLGKKLTHWKRCEEFVFAADLQKQCVVTWAGFDPSSAKRPGNGFVVVGLDNTGRRCILFTALKQSSDEIVDTLQYIEQTYNPQSIIVEDNGVQDQFIGMLQRMGKESVDPLSFTFVHRLEPITTNYSVKFDLFSGIPSLNNQFFNQSWRIPALEYEKHPMQCPCSWCALAQDAKKYPEVGRKYDVLCALFFAQIRAFSPRLDFYSEKKMPRYFGGVRAKSF